MTSAGLMLPTWQQRYQQALQQISSQLSAHLAAPDLHDKAWLYLATPEQLAPQTEPLRADSQRAPGALPWFDGPLGVKETIAVQAGQPAPPVKMRSSPG